ncbi:MAG: magnesium/cobalt transporter CorA [Treponema sp.]|jgi:magnesium transporter|nr:magnesium/cobalt transporter CorA [Treponema sp.]
MKKKIDLPQGNPIYIGDRVPVEMDLSIISYDSTSAQINHLSDIKEINQYKNNSKISWINISGLKDIDSIKQLGEKFDIHPLSVEDILHTEQPPKVEIFENYRYLSIKTIQREKRFRHNEEKKPASRFRKRNDRDENPEEFLIDQISIVIMKNVLMTFQEMHGDIFNDIRKKILENIGVIRKKGTDYLAYLIIDAVVDEYFLTINHLEDDIENYEYRSAKTNDEKFIEEIQDTKKYLSQIKRVISSLKDVINKITHHENFFQADELKPFLQDLNENINHALITVENYREWLSNIMDVNLSIVSYQTNKVMKVLTVISTIFIPLTFIAGVYGMNFEYMPELKYEIAYPIVLGGMGLVAAVMLIFLKIHHWF